MRIRELFRTLWRRLARRDGKPVHERAYQCGNCGRQFRLDRQYCPDCGSYRIERVQYDELLE